MALIVIVIALADPAWPRPQRIVSINVCADALILELAPRESIAAVTFLAGDPDYSPNAQAAQGIPVNHGRAEEVLALQADLVVAGRYSGQDSVRLLRALGIEVVELDLPVSIAEAREQIRTLAAALGEVARGEAVIARLDARLAAVRAGAGGRRPLAAIYQPNGFTAGSGSLADELLTWVGIDNLAVRSGIRFWGNLPLEPLLLAAPDLLILEQSGAQGPSLAQQLLSHPALRHLQANTLTVALPSRYWSCAGPWIAEAVEHLAAVRRLWSQRAGHAAPP